MNRDIIKEIENVDKKINNLKKDLNNIVECDKIIYNLIYEKADEKENIERLKSICDFSFNYLYNYKMRLGIMYLTGIGVKQDIDLAEKYLLEDGNTIMSDIALGYIYFNEKFNRQDYIKACKYFSRPVKAGYIKDVIFYYNLCEKAQGTKYNVQYACSILKGVLDTNKEACFKYAVAIKRGMIEDTVDVEKLLKEAVDANINGALYEYVDTLKGKYGITKEVVRLLEDDVKNVNINSMYELATIYANNKEYYNIEKAISLYEKCIEKSHPYSMLELGKIYSNEKYGKLDIKKAKEYFNSAIKNGVLVAEMELMKLEKRYE